MSVLLSNHGHWNTFIGSDSSIIGRRDYFPWHQFLHFVTWDVSEVFKNFDEIASNRISLCSLDCSWFLECFWNFHLNVAAIYSSKTKFFLSDMKTKQPYSITYYSVRFWCLKKVHNVNELNTKIPIGQHIIPTMWKTSKCKELSNFCFLTSKPNNSTTSSITQCVSGTKKSSLCQWIKHKI